MRTFDGAETCELVGSYLLNQLPVGIRNQIGLYRDDGLGPFQQTPKEIERIKKEICKVFSNNGLKITIGANKKIVNFLDVTLNLNKGTYEPYAKPITHRFMYIVKATTHIPSLRTFPWRSIKDSAKSHRTKSSSIKRHPHTSKR